jgi:hypothetical protein
MAVILEQAITDAMHTAIPRKRKKPADEIKLSHNIKTLVKERNYTRRIYKDIGTLYLKNKIRTQNREIRREIKRLRRERWEDQLLSLNKNDGSIWKIVKSLRRTPQSDPIVKTDDREIYNPKEKADVMANNLEKTFSINKPSLSTPNIDIKPENWEINLETVPEITLNDIRKIIKNLPNRKATGEDNIPNEVIKKIPIEAGKYIVEIANRSIRTGHFPRIWKNYLIKCIPKKQKKTGAPPGTIWLPI